MPDARDILGTVFKGGTATLLARVVGATGTALTQAVVSAITYTVYALDSRDPDTRTAVAAHTAQALVVASTIFDTLQDDALWDRDATGYNFRHTLDTAGLGAAFSEAGIDYQVEVTITPTSGQPILLRFRLACI